METGNKSIETPISAKFNNSISGKRIAINISYEDLCIIVADTSKNKILEILEVPLKKGIDGSSFENELEKLLRPLELEIKSAQSVHCVLNLPQFVLVPDVLFNREKAASYLKYNSRVDNAAEVLTDTWSQQDLVCVYAVQSKLKAYLDKLNKSSSIAHIGYSINRLHLLQPAKDDFCFLTIQEQSANLFLVSSGQFLLFNNFQYQAQEDLLYMLLFALEQNKLIAPEVKLRFAGNMQKGDELYKLLATYIGSIEEIGLPAGYTSDSTIALKEMRKWAHIIASI